MSNAKLCKTCGKGKRALGRSFCQKCIWSKARVKKEVRKLKKKIKRENNTRLLKKKLDTVFSIYIRKKYSDQWGKAKCVSCPKIDDWSKLQNGHYISRGNYSTRYSEKNCFVQCVGCNLFKKGNYPAFTKFILDNHGEQYLQDLIAEGQKIRQWTAPELKELITKYEIPLL